MKAGNPFDMDFQPSACRCRSLITLTFVPVALAFAGFLPPAKAGDNNPFDGYSGFTTSYFLPYAGGSSSDPNNPSADVQINVSISGASHASNTFNLDTGSRGLYAASTELGGIYTDPTACLAPTRARSNSPVLTVTTAATGFPTRC
jgi:hypothetical protein